MYMDSNVQGIQYPFHLYELKVKDKKQFNTFEFHLKG